MHKPTTVSWLPKRTGLKVKYSIFKTKCRTKTDINRRAISELREDINALEMQIHKCDTHITELIREN